MSEIFFDRWYDTPVVRPGPLIDAGSRLSVVVGWVEHSLGGRGQIESPLRGVRLYSGVLSGIPFGGTTREG